MFKKFLDYTGLIYLWGKLNNKIDQRIAKAMIAHVLDSTNKDMVLGADQAPVITRLIDAERARITKLNSDYITQKDKLIRFEYDLSTHNRVNSPQFTIGDPNLFPLRTVIQKTRQENGDFGTYILNYMYDGKYSALVLDNRQLMIGLYNADGTTISQKVIITI